MLDLECLLDGSPSCVTTRRTLMDLFVVPTTGFDLLYAFVIIRLNRRDPVWINVTRNPTAEWVARQITEAFPWDGAPPGQNTLAVAVM